MMLNGLNQSVDGEKLKLAGIAFYFRSKYLSYSISTIFISLYVLLIIKSLYKKAHAGPGTNTYFFVIFQKSRLFATRTSFSPLSHSTRTGSMPRPAAWRRDPSQAYRPGTLVLINLQNSYKGFTALDCRPCEVSGWPYSLLIIMALGPITALPVTCVRRRSGKVYGHITSIIIDRETRLPAAAMVLVARTQMTQRVPWSLLIETDNGEGYRLKIGVGELALMVAEKRDTDFILVWHDGMDWLIRKDCEGYRTAALDSDTWISGPPLGMTEEDLDLLFPSSRT
jgi:hypothetical protein